jgi:hypothetical protein
MRFRANSADFRGLLVPAAYLHENSIELFDSSSAISVGVDMLVLDVVALLSSSLNSR